jgi:hypothetical protein
MNKETRKKLESLSGENMPDMHGVRALNDALGEAISKSKRRPPGSFPIKKVKASDAITDRFKANAIDIEAVIDRVNRLQDDYKEMKSDFERRKNLLLEKESEVVSFVVSAMDERSKIWRDVEKELGTDNDMQLDDETGEITIWNTKDNKIV